MFRKVDVQLKPITLELACEMMAMQGLTRLPADREVKEPRLKFLRGMLAKGEFAGTNWAIGTHRETGERYRLNGQHSSKVLAELTPETFPAGLLATIDYYEFDSLAEDVPPLFNSFDNPQSARSDKDYMGVLRVGHPDLVEAGMDAGFLMKVTDGIAYNRKRQELRAREELSKSRATALAEGKPVPPNIRPDVSKWRMLPHREYGLYFDQPEHRRFALWLWKWSKTLHFTFSNRAGIVSEMLDDWGYNQSLATEFWGFVLREDHPQVDHESREFVRSIMDMLSRPRPKNMDFEKQARKSWNKFRRLREAELGRNKAPGTDPVMPEAA